MRRQNRSSFATRSKASAKRRSRLQAAKKKRVNKNDPNFSPIEYAYKLSDGIDLSEIEGVSHNTVLTIMAEAGLKLDKFDTAKQFTSWLGLAPNRRITGGKVISSKTSKNTGRLAKAFRDAANVVGNQKDTYLSDCFRKTAYGKGRKTAVIKTARKIAIIVFNMLKKGEDYQPFDYEKYEAEQRRRKILNIQRTMEKMDIDISELAM